MLPGFEVIAADRAGGTFVGVPWRIVLHTTEGGSTEGAVGAYRSHGGWPHFTVDPKIRRRVQHYELNVSSRALANASGGVETNRANVINIEIVGFATQTPAWSAEWLRWLGTDVLAPIRAVCPFDLVAPHFVPYPQSYGYRAMQRFDSMRWLGFSGLVGHQHAPENDHGDPGALDVTEIIAAMRGTAPAPTRRFKVNAIVSDPVSGETQIAELRDDLNVWLRNIKTGAGWYTTGPVPEGKPVSLDACYRKDGTLDVSVHTDKGRTWVIGAPPGGRFGSWYLPG